MLQPKPYLKSTIVTCYLLFCVVGFVAAQVNTTAANIDIEPYKTVELGAYKITGKIKQAVDLRLVQKGVSSGNDTIQVVQFDEKGQKTNYKGFDLNGKKTIVIYTHHNKPGLKECWQDEYKGKNYTRYVVDSVFNKEGQVVATKFIYFNNKDTSLRMVHTFTYDADGNMTGKKYFANGRLLNFSNYSYSNQKLVKQTDVLHPEQKGIYLETIFTYDSLGRVLKKENYEERNNTRTLYGFNNYSYTDNRLTAETYAEVSNLRSPTIATYEYNDEKLLSKISLKRDTAYKEIGYSYDIKGRLIKIHSETNVLYGLNREASQLLAEYREKMPVVYEQKYKYDNYGNLSERSATVNGELRLLLAYSRLYY